MHHLMSTFDEKRKVRTAITDRRKTAVPIRTVNSELTCRVCL